MKVHTCVTQLREPKNDMLPKFPPFAGDGQKLQDDKSKDLIEAGLPMMWQKQSTPNGFNSLNDTVASDAVIERAEHIENAEVFEPKTPKKEN